MYKMFENDLKFFLLVVLTGLILVYNIRVYYGLCILLNIFPRVFT